MSTTTSVKAPQDATLFRKSGIYQIGTGTLFVRTPGMRLLHEASQGASSIEATIQAARSLAEWGQGPRRLGLNPGQVYFWLNQYRAHSWFKLWLLRNARLPTDVNIATPRQVDACRRAWHYTKLCRQAGVERHRYHRWIVNKQVPDAWRPWLFGEDAPNGAFVVELPLQRLRKEMAPAAIVAAAGMTADTLWEWNKNPIIRKALEWATTWIVRAREGLKPPWPEWAQALPTRTKSNLIRYARQATLSSCCARAGLRFDEYCKKLAHSKRLGVGELVENFLHRRAPFRWEYHGPKEQRYGLVAENFFIPTEKMIAFRQAARNEASRVGLARALYGLKGVGYKEWFLDWTSPRGTKGPGQAEVAKGFASQGGDGATTNGAVQHGTNGSARKKGEPDQPPVAVESETPTVTNAELKRPDQSRLPAMLSAPELARILRKPVRDVRRFLDSYCENKPDSVEEIDNRRRNEPKFLYRTADVWPPLLEAFPQQ